MTDEPTVDGRRAGELLEEAEDRAPYYVEEWDPDADDAGTVLLELFSEIAENVTERLDRVPEKHRVAFFDALGFTKHPSQPARLPLSFQVADGAGDNVAVPAGTQALAEAANGGPEQTFEIAPGDGFEATPATLARVHTVDPDDDAIFEHRDPLSTGASTGLFDGTDLQEHVLYVGHGEQLNLEPGSTIRVTVETEDRAAFLGDRLEWEYYGEQEVDGEAVEGWHPLERTGGNGSTSPSGGGVTPPSSEPPKTEPSSGSSETEPSSGSPGTGSGSGTEPPSAPDRRGDARTRLSIEALAALAGELAELDSARRLVEELSELASAEKLLDEFEEREAFEELIRVARDRESLAAVLRDERGREAIRRAFEGLAELESIGPLLDEIEGRESFERFAGELSELGSVERLFGERGRETVERLVERASDPDYLRRIFGELSEFEPLYAFVRELTGLESFDAFVEDLAEVEPAARLREERRERGSIRDAFGRERERRSIRRAFEELTALDSFERLVDDLRDLESLHRLVEKLAEVEPLEPFVGALRGEIRSDGGSGGPARTDGSGGPVELTFRLPGETVETGLPGEIEDPAIAGIESRWIRCAIADDGSPDDLFRIEVRSVSLGARPDDLRPDAVFHNDVPLQVEPENGMEIHPLGRIPRPPDTFYLASEEAFTKRGAEVTLAFDGVDGDGDAGNGTTGDAESGDGGAGEGDGGNGNGEDGEDRSAPDLSWEYWNGDGWTRLPLVGDDTDRLRAAGEVAFRVPDDLAQTGVAGHDGYWIRVRLVGGDYGEVSYDAEGEPDRSGVGPPRFGGVTVRYDRKVPPTHLVTHNNLAYGDDLAAEEFDRFAPFAGVPDETQSLYLGFDGALHDGPINLFFPVEDQEFPEGFYSRPRWEYLSDVGGDGWSRLDVRDGTEGLTERGIVSLVFPEPTDAVELFGTTRHWIRARITGDAFERDAPADGTDAGEERTTPRGLPEPCEETLSTDPPAGGPERTPPTLSGLYPNTGWAANVRTVDGEVLGSSDGSPDQEFSVASPPIIEGEIRVDELAALSEGARRELSEARPDDVEEVTGPQGDPRAFWVRWTEVADFLDSGPDDRHYTLDRAAGRIAFGDGVRGKIPSIGRDNVRASYTTGGGADGNVGAAAVTGLRSSIPLVDAVTNPEPGDGGADEESVDGVVTRAPRQLRDRGRAVSGGDFERIALDASRKLARARCIPGMDDAGGRTPGWVTLLIVPGSRRAMPTPSVELKEQVVEAVTERAPASLVHADADRLVVRGPSYVEVAVTADLEAATGVGSISSLEKAATERVAAFLHPLSGGAAGDGWTFGELPCLSDLYALLERVDGVDHVAELAMTFRGSGEEVTVTEAEPVPEVASDVLVFSGTHEITARGGR